MKTKQWIVSRLANFPVIRQRIFRKHLSLLMQTDAGPSHWLFPRRYFVDHRNKVVYYNNAKVACSSIKMSMVGRDSENFGEVHRMNGVDGFNHQHELTSEECIYESFTFVRNPYARLASAYRNKFLERGNRKSPYKGGYLDGYLAWDRGFADFVRKVCRIPDELLEWHIASQYYLVHDLQGNRLVDHVGHIESLAADFEPIRARYGYLPLKQYNRSEKYDWRAMYTPELADLVYEKYRRDFEAFGYSRESYLQKT